MTFAATLEVSFVEEREAGGDALEIFGWQNDIIILQAHVHHANVFGSVVFKLIHVIHRFLFLKPFKQSLIFVMDMLLF